MFDCYGTPEAFACIRGGEAYPQIKGTMKLYPHCNGVLVVVQVCGLPPTQDHFFALHIHDGDDCCGDGFPNTGSHYNPRNEKHPQHAGDLPPLLSCSGKAYLAVVTDRFRICDVIGRTVIIHLGTDDFTTQPSGNAGTKIACGVIGKR